MPARGSESPSVQLQGACAFVTGGAQGIGLGISKGLANAGARLAIADIDKEALVRAKDELLSLTDVEAFDLDVRDRSRFAQVADEAETRLGPISILCNNAGVGGSDSVRSMSYEMWDWMLGINVGGIVNGLQTFVPRMIERRTGHIVNTASGAGLAVDPEWQIGFMYPTSKYAIVGLSEALRPELAEYGIGVSVLCPGTVSTKILSNSALARPRNGRRPSPHQLAELDLIVRQRGLSPDDVGELVVEGIKDNAMYIITHQNLKAPVEARFSRILDAFSGSNSAPHS